MEFDFGLFHAVPGAWHSVEHMRECLSNREWLLHAGFFRRREAAQRKAADDARREAKRRH